MRSSNVRVPDRATINRSKVGKGPAAVAETLTAISGEEVGIRVAVVAVITAWFHKEKTSKLTRRKYRKKSGKRRPSLQAIPDVVRA